MKAASRAGDVCENLMLSKLCSIFLAFLEVLHPLRGESKPADSRLAFLTPPFHTLFLHSMQTRGWKPLLAPLTSPRAATPAQHMGK